MFLKRGHSLSYPVLCLYLKHYFFSLSLYYYNVFLFIGLTPLGTIIDLGLKLSVQTFQQAIVFFKRSNLMFLSFYLSILATVGRNHPLN